MLENILKYQLLSFTNFKVEVSQVLFLGGLFLICWLLLKVVKFIITKNSRYDEGQKYTFYTILKYCIYLVVVYAALSVLAINLSVLVAGSAALFVGIGLGLQGLFHDFISGIILLIDGSVKVGNVIQVGEKRVEILSIRFRTSVVKTRDEKEIILPNSFLTKNEIINWSNQKNINRHFVELQVSDKDVEKAMLVIIESVKNHPKVLSQPDPYVRIERFSSYAVELKVLFWSHEVLAVGRMLGEVRLNILKALGANDIFMPFPEQKVTVNLQKDSAL